MAMMSCAGCGGQMHEAASACPSCGRPAGPASVTMSVQKSGYFGFHGRISRKDYWLLYGIPLFVLNLASGFVGGLVFDGMDRTIFNLVMLVVMLVPSLAAGVKRAHDRNRSGWFVLVGLIPLVGFIWLFVELGCLRGTVGSNRFGTDPVQAAMRLETVPA